VTGTIKNINQEKGFGFIQGEDGKEYFFHRSACIGVRFADLEKDREVRFVDTRSPKGPRAENVEV
jgi:CspA family cold shock protein